MYIEITNLYEEHISKEQLKEKLDKFLNDKIIFSYWFIKHDKDIYETGTLKGQLKKVHYHCCIDIDVSNFDNNHESISKFCSCVFKNDFPSDWKLDYKRVRSLSKFLSYLTHKNNKNKYQYNDSEVITNDFEKYNESVCIEASSNESKYNQMGCNALVTLEQLLSGVDAVCVGRAYVEEYFKKCNAYEYFMQYQRNIFEVLTNRDFNLCKGFDVFDNNGVVIENLEIKSQEILYSKEMISFAESEF